MNPSSIRLLTIFLLIPVSGLSQEIGTQPIDAEPAWPPLLVGALIGLLSMATFYFSNHPLGASTAYARVSGLLAKIVSRNHVADLRFFDKKAPAIEWQTMLVLGVVLGAFVAAWSGGELTGRWIPPLWDERFGPSILPRLFVGLLGGALMAFGARVAGGCTSGHGISGALQLSVGSWIALICFFAGGIATAFLMFRI